MRSFSCIINDQNGQQRKMSNALCKLKTEHEAHTHTVWPITPNITHKSMHRFSLSRDNWNMSEIQVNVYYHFKREPKRALPHCLHFALAHGMTFRIHSTQWNSESARRALDKLSFMTHHLIAFLRALYRIGSAFARSIRLLAPVCIQIKHFVLIVKYFKWIFIIMFALQTETLECTGLKQEGHWKR